MNGGFELCEVKPGRGAAELNWCCGFLAISQEQGTGQEEGGGVMMTLPVTVTVTCLLDQATSLNHPEALGVCISLLLSGCHCQIIYNEKALKSAFTPIKNAQFFHVWQLFDLDVSVIYPWHSATLRSRPERRRSTSRFKRGLSTGLLRVRLIPQEMLQTSRTYTGQCNTNTNTIQYKYKYKYKYDLYQKKCSGRQSRSPHIHWSKGGCPKVCSSKCDHALVECLWGTPWKSIDDQIVLNWSPTYTTTNAPDVDRAHLTYCTGQPHSKSVLFKMWSVFWGPSWKAIGNQMLTSSF